MDNTEKKDIRVLQEKILEIAKYFDSFCTSHNIEYFLEGGTALGAIRHQGFIPWDDDFDVCMTYDNYTKFLGCAREHLDKDKFYLQEEDTKEWPLYFSKLRMNGTTFIEVAKDRQMHKGIYIDIFCLHNVSDNAFYARIQELSAKLLVVRSLGRRGYVTNSKSKKIIIFIANIFVRGFFKKLLFKIVKSKNKSSTKRIGQIFGSSKLSKLVFPAEYFTQQKYVDFEDTKLPVPIKVEEYLTVVFGDYMKLPSLEERKSAQHALIWDTEKDYREYEEIEA